MTLLLEPKEKEKLLRLRLVSLFLIVLGLLAVSFVVTTQLDDPEDLIIASEQKVRKRTHKAQTPALEVFPVNEVKESLFLPSLVTKLTRYQIPPRPDAQQGFMFLQFQNEPFRRLQFGDSIYLTIKGNRIEPSEKETPLVLSLSESGEQATLSATIVADDLNPLLSESYTFSTDAIPVQKTACVEEGFVSFCKELGDLRLYGPDQFFQQFGGEKLSPKGRFFRLGSSFTQVYCIEAGDIFTLQMGELVPIATPKNAKCPLLRVKQIDKEGALLEAWDESGKEYATISILADRPKGIQIRAEEIFKDVRVKGRDRAVVKVGKKTKILSPGDYLLSDKGKWVLVDKKDTLDRLINYLQSGILFVFEGFVKQGNTTLFVGTLFDETRSLSKKVQLPLKVSQNPKAQSRGMRRGNHTNRAMPPPEPIPPELEDLFDELDDL